MYVGVGWRWVWLDYVGLCRFRFIWAGLSYFGLSRAVLVVVGWVVMRCLALLVGMQRFGFVWAVLGWRLFTPWVGLVMVSFGFRLGCAELGRVGFRFGLGRP